MKRKFTILIAAIAAILMITQPLGTKGQTRATDAYKKTKFNSTNNSQGVQDYTSTWYNTTNGFRVDITNANNSNNAWYYIKMGRKNNASTGTIITNATIDKPVSSVSIRISALTASKITSITLYTKTANGSWSSAGTFTKGTGLQSVSIPSPTKDLYYKIEAVCTSGTSNGLLTIDSVLYNVETFTVTYNNNGGSGTMTDSNSPYWTGSTVTTKTNTFTAPTGFTFNGWNTAANGSGTAYAEGATFTINANTTLYAQWAAAGDYISVDPTSADIDCTGDVAEFNMTTNISTPSYAIKYYTSSECDEETTKPTWFGDVEFSSNTLDIEVNPNTGAARSAYFKVYSGTTYSDVVTINQAVYAPSAPTLPAAGNFDYTKEITITVPDGTTVYYTLDGTNPTSSSTAYSAPFTINATKTVKAVAYDGSYPSAVVSATYTRTYKYINEITAAGTYTVKGTVVAVYGTTGFVLGDGTGYIYDYKSSHGLSVGDKVSITSGTIKDYNHVWEFNSASTSAVATSSYTTGTPAITTLTSSIISSYSSATNLSTYFEVVGLYSNTNKEITVSGSSIPVRLSTTTDYGSLNGKTVKAKGYFLGFNKDTEYFYLCPESVEAVPVLTTSVSSISDFTYNVGGGPDVKSFTVSGANLTNDLTVTASGNYKVCKTSDGTYTSSVSYEPSTGTVASTTVYVRLDSGLSSNTYEGTVTVASTGAVSKVVNLTGTVTHVIAYDGSLPTGCSVSSEPNGAQVAGESVSLTATAGSGYKFSAWDVYKTGESSTKVDVEDDAFTMPSYNVTVSAAFVEAYTVTYDANGGSGTMTDPNSPYASGTTVNVLDNSFTRTGYSFASWNTADDGSGTTYYGATSGSTPKSFTITSNTILYAQWTINTHNITMPDDDDYGSYEASETTAVEYDTEVELTYTPESGYEHYVAVWSVNGTPIVGNTFNMPDEDVTVTVAPHATWTVTYNANGGTGSMSDPNSPYDNGDDVTVLANGFTYLNHTFVKWNTQADGKGTDYDPDDVIEDISANITLFAQWENGSHVTYTVTSTSSVSTSGSAPIGSKAIFTQTYGTACQMTGGNSMTLTLKGYQAQTVKSIVLSMKSNKSAGAGTLAVVAGSTTLASIDNSGAGVAFSNSAWNGSYTQSYTDVTPAMTDDDYEIQAGENIVITISATTSSLFCESFTINYETSDSPAVITSETEQTVTHASQSITTGDKVFELYSLNITTPTFALSYCDEDGTVLGSNPYSSWFTAAVTDNEKVTYSVTANTGGDRTAYFKVYATVAGDPVYSGLCSVTQKHQPHTYTLVDGSTVTLEAGKHYIIASGTSNGKIPAMGKQNGTIRDTVHVKVSSGTFTEVDGLYEVVLSGDNTNKWTMYDVKNSQYICATSSSSNDVGMQTDYDANGQWAISMDESAVTLTAQGSYTKNLFRYNSGSPRFSCYSSGQSAVYLYKRDGDKDLEFYSPTTLESATIASDETYTVESGQTLNIATLTNSGSATNLIIEDGGQLITNSAVAATIRKNVASATSRDDHVYGWYTISSPLATTKIAGDGANTNLTTGTYDLLRYDEGSHTWENYKAGHGDFANMTAGRGYIYRNSGDVTVEYKGTVNNGEVDYPVTKDGDMLTGFNLIGNPYPHEIYKGAGTAIPNSKADDYVLATGFYTLTKEGAWHSGTDNSTAILPGQGLLVQATTAGTISMTNTPSDGSAKTNNDNIKFSVANSRYEDVTYAWFDKGIGLDKIDHRNPDVPMLYISRDDKNYAVATMSDDTEAFNLCFKAKKMGQYTLSYAAKGEFNYLHVIDCLTGDDVDMLLEEKYVFTATPQDKANRFIVRLAYKAGNVTSYDDSFAYQNGSDIIVNGEGELQIFDVMGRMVAKRHINGVETMCTSSLQTGVYILRMAGNDIKTQKIIIK